MPRRAHRDAVGDRDRVELHRRAAGVADALLDLGGERAQVEVARHRLDPGRGDADDRLGERLVVVADALQVGARGGARRALGEGAAAVLEVEAVRGSRRGHYRRRARAASGDYGAATPPGVRGARRRRSRSHWLRRQRSRRTCFGSIWRPGRCMFARRDQALLVAGQRHPLGQHVVGVRQPRAAVGARLVGERDAVLVEQLAGLRQVGDDRLVRVDQVGVGAPARGSSPCARAAAPRAMPPHTRMNPRSRYIDHSSSLTHERSSWRARCSARRSRPGS